MAVRQLASEDEVQNELYLCNCKLDEVSTRWHPCTQQDLHCIRQSSPEQPASYSALHQQACKLTNWQGETWVCSLVSAGRAGQGRAGQGRAGQASDILYRSRIQSCIFVEYV